MFSRFDITELTRFVLTVRKNYRRVPYHNWTHAFTVAHCMYCVVKESKRVIDGLEVSFIESSRLIQNVFTLFYYMHNI